MIQREANALRFRQSRQTDHRCSNRAAQRSNVEVKRKMLVFGELRLHRFQELRQRLLLSEIGAHDQRFIKEALDLADGSLRLSRLLSVNRSERGERKSRQDDAAESDHDASPWSEMKTAPERNAVRGDTCAVFFTGNVKARPLLHRF